MNGMIAMNKLQLIRTQLKKVIEGLEDELIQEPSTDDEIENNQAIEELVKDVKKAKKTLEDAKTVRRTFKMINNGRGE
jgi:alkyl hydroperoxide reductase subunit AhpF